MALFAVINAVSGTIYGGFFFTSYDETQNPDKEEGKKLFV